MRCSTNHRRWGYTLVELVASMAVMSILMVALGSVMILATQAIPENGSPLHATVDASLVADDIAGDLYCALSFTERTAKAVEFTVPDRDRDADSLPETIRYEWSGTPGDPLMRRYNGGTAVNVAEDVREFQLSYDLRTISREEPPTENESNETVVASWDSTVNLSDVPVSSDFWVGEYFKPTLPGDTVSWKVTRVKFKAREEGAANGQTMVQLRPPTTGNLPSSTVLEQLPMYESSLTTSFVWQEFSFSNVAGLSPSQGLCLVLEHVSDAHSCMVEYQGGSVSLPNAGLLEYNGSWTLTTDKDLNFYIYGTVTTTGEPTVVELKHLTGVRISIRLGEDPSSRVETGVQVLNIPEVAAP